MRSVPPLLRYYETLRHPRIRHTPLDYETCLPSRAPVFVSPSCPTPARGPGALQSGSPTPVWFEIETADSLKFLEIPLVLLPCSPTPAGPAHQALAMRRRGPRNVHGEGSHGAAFEAQSHGFGTGCLRFAGRVTPTPRKTRFRLLAKLSRTGLFTRRVPSKGFKVYPTSILLSQVQRSARTFYFSETSRMSPFSRLFPGP